MELDDLPTWTRARQGLVRLFDSRMSSDLEWAADYSVQDATLEIDFFAARAPLCIEIITLGDRLTRATSLTYELASATCQVDFQVRESMNGDAQQSVLRPARMLKAQKVTIQFEPPAAEVQMRVNIRVVGRSTPKDLLLIGEAEDQLQRGEGEEAILTFREYGSRYSKRNPSVAFGLASAYKTCAEYDSAEDSAVTALVHGNFDTCVDLYQAIQRARPTKEVRAIHELQKRGQVWDVGRQHGLLVLEKTQEFHVGFDGYYLKKCCEIVEVRRAAAARMLRAMEFQFSAHSEALIHSSVRVVHANNDIEDVPLEHFRILDHETQDAFVAVEDHKSGHWILPDLVAGDVIEWTYHILCRERRVDGEASLFVLTSLCHEYFPTLHAQCAFIAPGGWPLHISTRNTSAGLRKHTAEERDTYSYEASNFLPARRTGFAYENFSLNPLIAAARTAPSWGSFAGAALRTNFGELDEAAVAGACLRGPLSDILERSSEPFAALEQAFYWVRDNLKYASFLSGKKLIGESNRAEKILDAGVGDCNDKSYLLHLVCRRLGITSEFILVSTSSGVIVEDLPADQFDHVFLRARRQDGWIYLDAANPMSVFGSAPGWCQGFRAVVLNEAGERTTIGVDAPEANRIDIREVFSTRRDGLLRGSFDVKARGQVGRYLDERWKAMSLSMTDQLQAGQDCLRSFLPSALVGDFEVHSQTSTSNVFHVSGEHARCPLSTLEGNRHDVGTLTWAFPMLPLHYWRTLEMEKLFVFDLPMAIGITVTLDQELFQALGDVSGSSSLENSFCTIHQSVSRDAQTCSIHRSIEIKRRFIEAPDIDRVPDTLEQLETALQLVLVLGPS